MKKYRKLFQKQVPYFIAAWVDIQKNGFFKSLSFILQGSDEDDSVWLDIRTQARISEEEKFRRKGISPYYDPELLLNNLKHHFEKGEFKVTFFSCKVEAGDWPLYNEKDKRVGSKGREMEMSLSIGLEKKKKQ